MFVVLDDNNKDINENPHEIESDQDGLYLIFIWNNQKTLHNCKTDTNCLLFILSVT